MDEEFPDSLEGPMSVTDSVKPENVQAKNQTPPSISETLGKEEDKMGKMKILPNHTISKTQ